MIDQDHDALHFGTVFAEPEVLSRIEVSRNGEPCLEAKILPKLRTLSNWQPSLELTKEITDDLAKMHERDRELYKGSE